MIVSKCIFQSGDVYLFNETDRRCPSVTSLWGMFDTRKSGEVYLESSTVDLKNFTAWCRLPSQYRFCRLSTRAELRDYIADLISCQQETLDRDNVVPSESL